MPNSSHPSFMNATVSKSERGPKGGEYLLPPHRSLTHGSIRPAVSPDPSVRKGCEINTN